MLGNNGVLVDGNWSSFSSSANTILSNQQINGTKLVSRNGKYEFKNSRQLVFNYSDSHWNMDNAFQKLDEHEDIWQENEEKQILLDLSVT